MSPSQQGVKPAFETARWVRQQLEICHKHLSEKIEKFRDNELKDRQIRATADFPKRVSVFYVMRLITGIFSMMKTGGSLTRGPLRS